MNVESPFAAQLQARPVEKRELAILGSITRYWVYGEADADITVVVTHGYRGEHHGLEPIVAQLPTVRFVSPDLPGFGESTPLTERRHDVDGYAAWLTQFVEALGLSGKAVILGHSFGTIVTSSAVANGLATPGLILINPISVSGLKGPRPLATRATVWYYKLASRLPERLGHCILGSWFIVRGMSLVLMKTRDKQVRRWIHSEHHTYFSRYANRDVVIEAFHASIADSVADFADQITVPTLLVAAELDDITPLSAHPPIIEAIGNAQLVVIPGVGHLIHYETPVPAAEAITQFLTTLKLP
ncbi:MAG: alpha/beta hydrolase [Homoserinimonas sp.]|nr:alpha/beta hydrolase [Homoserinimonas sp.]